MSSIPVSINAEMHNRTQVMTKGLINLYNFINSSHPKNKQKDLTPAKTAATFRSQFPVLSVHDVGARPFEFGDLTIQGKVGQGACGKVFWAQNKAKEYKVLKFVDAPDDARNEAKTLHKLRNAKRCLYIVYLERVIPGPHKGSMVFQSPYAGKSVYDLYIKGPDTISCENLKIMTWHVLLAIQHLKNLGLQHRDIKPDNIVHNTALKVFQLIDFGISEAQVEYPYTIWYRPFEAYLDGPIDDRSEVFALGASIDTCITKQHPSLITDKPADDDANQANHAHELHQVLGDPAPDVIQMLRRKPQKVVSVTPDGKLQTKPTRNYKPGPKWSDTIQQRCKDRGYTKKASNKWVDFLAGIYQEQSQRWNIEDTLKGYQQYLLPVQEGGEKSAKRQKV